MCSQRMLPFLILSLSVKLSHVQLFATLWTVAHQASLSMGFFRQEYWSGLPFPPLRDLPNPGIEPTSPDFLVLQPDSLPLSHQGSRTIFYYKWQIQFSNSIIPETVGQTTSQCLKRKTSNTQVYKHIYRYKTF